MLARKNESLFSMSAFDGLLAIRRYSAAHPATGIEDVVSSLRRVSADDAYHDYDTATILAAWSITHLTMQMFRSFFVIRWAS